jgi:inosine/xanthosine triphosphatase
MKVAIGSKNPVKIASVQDAFELVWPDPIFDFEGIDVASGVSDQPMTDVESIKGATNRAQRALDALQADYGVGLEGGIQQIGDEYFDCGWIVVLDKQGKKGIGSSIRMIVPPKMIRLIKEGEELGTVVDMVFGTQNSKHAGGHFGLMTNNAVTRLSGYRDGIISALAVFIHPEVFKD